MDRSRFRFGALLALLVVIAHVDLGDAIGCSDTSIGIENVNIFPNSRFTATSTYDNRYVASNARLGVNLRGWGASTNNQASDHLRIDLGSVYIICAVATQGSASVGEWVRNYLITTSVDGSQYATYRENGADKVFTGNTNQNSIVKNSITELKARYIRFYPRDYNVHKTMRVGVFGYKEECAKKTIGLENKYIIPDSSFRASTQYSNNYHPYHARLNSGLRGWAARTSTDPNDYLQIDLGLPYVICGVATQGNSIGGEWVTQYKIRLSMDGIGWTTYQEGGVDKVFQGNVDHSIIMLNQLNKKTTRYLRFIPTAYNGHKTMRVGVFGYLEACIKRSIGMESGAIQDGSITASSAQHPAKNARLHYTSGSSWCASTSDSDPYLQIDLGSSHLICAVATQGNSMADQWVKTYQITTSNDGSSWTTYTENSVTRTLYGNYDRTTIARQVLYSGIVTRYLRIVPKTYQTGTPCLRTEIYGYPFNTGCSSHSVGIPSPLFLPDHRFTATSAYNDVHSPPKGRLGAASAWAARTNTNSDDYLQVDLGAVFYICTVATQGTGYSANEWVTKYKVLYSTNNNQWNTYSESGANKEFTGNTDKTTVVSNPITKHFKAKFVRVQPTTYSSHKSMRIEFKGIAAACISSLGLENSKIKDSQITSSSSLDNSHSALNGRLYGSSSWCSSTNSNTEYIQVDLGQVKTVTGIATQGDKTVEKWTITYKVSYSFGEGLWFEYREGASPKTFNGNTNKNDVRVNWLTRPMAARYFKVLPQVSNAGHCLRLELYGCEFFYPISASLNTASVVLSSRNNSSENLTCSVSGEPLPDIQWLNNGTKISGATQASIQLVFISAAEITSTYSCSRPDPSNRTVICNKFYTCRAKYIFIVPSGTVDEATAKVTVYLNVSEAPSVTAVPFQRSIRLRWILPNPSDDVGAITSYLIEFNNQSTMKTISVGHQASPFNLTYLRPYTNYTVRIRAISAPGQGLWSTLVSVRTVTAEPDGIPSITSLTALTSQSIRIDWQFTQSDKVNGPMAGFRITYRKEGGATKMIDVGDVRSYNLTSLEKNTNYKFNVSVRNTQYFGQPSVEVERRTLEDAPECAPVLKFIQSLSSNSVLLIWSSLQNQKCTNGVLRGYKVVYRGSRNESLPLQEHPVNIPSAITTVVSGLVQSVEYTFQVRAFTVKDGILSNSLTGTVQPVGNLSVVKEKMTPLVRATIGEKVSVGCYATGARPIKYRWLKKDAPMNSSSINVLHNFLLLEVKTELDFGAYLCNVTNNNGEVVSYEVKIEQVEICEQSAGSGNLTILRDRMTSLVRAGTGDRVVIGCYATSGQPIRYHWTLNGAPIISSAARIIHNVLVIEPKTAMDYGIYVCNVTSENNTDSYPIKLMQLETCKGPNSTQGNVTILSDKMTPLVKAALNEKVVFSCFATGTPPIRYIWTKDGAPINSSSLKVIDNTVIVEPKTAEFYGTYLCQATNGNQTASYEVKLELSEVCSKGENLTHQGLKILKEKMTSIVKAAIGQNISIGCYATGAQPIKYSWTKDGSLISSLAVKVVDNVLFVQPKTPLDYGTYLCSVSNQNKTVSFAFELSPWESCEQRSNSSENKGKLKILINMMMSSVTVATGNRVSIGCYATGVPPIRYTWTKDGIRVKTSAVIQNVLVIQPKAPMDYGNYSCHVSNGNETDSYSIQVNPSEKRQSPDSDKNQTHQGDLNISREKMTSLVRARYGDKVSLGCYATGAPPIRYSWTKNNHPIANSETIKVLDNVVVVRPKSSDDYGTFVCSVSNARRTVSYVIKLQHLDIYDGGDPNTSQSQQGFKNIYLPIMIVLAIIIIILLILIGYLARRKKKGDTSSNADSYMKMDDIIRSRNETTRNTHASLPPVPTSPIPSSAAAAAACNTQTESHYDSIDGGYVNAAALTKTDQPDNDDFEDLYALKNSTA